LLINSLPTNPECEMKKSSIPFLNTKTSYFYDKSPIMKWIKLTAFTSILFTLLLSFSACEKNAEKKIQTDFSKTGIVLNGAQETPPNPSTALGTMDVFYTRETRILSYTVKWSGMSDTVILMHIHGLGPAGYAAGVVQTILSAPNPTLFPKSLGTYSGSLLVDGVVVKEQDLLNGLYYMNIHTKTYPGGEIRAQIVFQ
jgi:CHRD domain